jgi:hypothetical protein
MVIHKFPVPQIRVSDNDEVSCHLQVAIFHIMVLRLKAARFVGAQSVIFGMSTAGNLPLMVKVYGIRLAMACIRERYYQAKKVQ